MEHTTLVTFLIRPVIAHSSRVRHACAVAPHPAPRERSRFDRFTHHEHGHGGCIAATGDVGSRFPVACSVDDGASVTRSYT